MQLVSYPQTIEALFRVQLVPFITLIIVMFLFSLFNRITKFKFFKKIKVIDFFPIFAVVAIHQITMNSHGTTFLPIFICGWMLIGIIWIIYLLMRNGEVIIKRFMIAFWRLADLYWLFIYLVCFVYEIFIKLS